MNVTIVGAGYVGLVTAACLADLGNDVLCVDQDPARIVLLQAGGVPIYEPGLDDLIVRNLEAGRLRFTHQLSAGVAHAEVLFIAVGTPPLEDGSADLQHVLAVARQVGACVAHSLVVVNKSTVPVGTAEAVASAIGEALQARGSEGLEVTVVSNPEFLKEGAAIEDFMRPDRIVVGVPPGRAGERARRCMARLYAPFNRHHERTVWMDVASAELTKYAANAMLATRISFMNEMAALADRVGADIDSVRRGIGADQRIGHSFLYAGTGYGGSCLPKDTRALVHTAATYGLDMRIVRAVNEVNTDQKQYLVRLLVQLMGEDLTGRRIAIWGLAFKPKTNDMREAPSRGVIKALLQRGAEVSAYDPVAMREAQEALAADMPGARSKHPRMHWVDLAERALIGADALLILTEWKCFQNPDLLRLRTLVRDPLVLDGRNLYEPALLQELGVAYLGIGRRNEAGDARLRRSSPAAAAAASRSTQPV